jgi:hypothetical protein
MISPGSVFPRINEAAISQRGTQGKVESNGRMAILGVGGANHHENLLRGKGKGDILGVGKRASKKREFKKPSFAKRIFFWQANLALSARRTSSA